MSPPEATNLVITICAQIGLLMATYFKLRNQFSTKISEVKAHTETSLHKLNGMLSYVVRSFDRPAWIKIATMREDGETEFRILEINDLYLEAFGLGRDSVIGKTDLEAGTPKKVADEMRMHDLAVWASGSSMTFVETINDKKLRFRKIRIQSSNGETKGIMCYAVECMEPLQCPFHTNWSHSTCPHSLSKPE